jgi:hypothetical protein
MSTQPHQAVPHEDRDLREVVHQALRREANEHATRARSSLHVAGADDAADEALDVLCECVRPGCDGHVVLARAEYELVRRFPSRFLVKSGHEVSERERVVGQADGHVVVEKIGRAGVYAVGIDPRRRSTRTAVGA